jgi:hypothetical protein
MYLMNTELFRSVGRSRNKSLVAIFLAITVLLLTHPIFAQSDDGAIAVKSIGVPAPAIAPNPGESGEQFTPSFSNAGLAPAPEEPAETESAPTYLPGSSADLVGPWMNQPIPPWPLQPDMSAAPRGFDGAIRP